MSNHTQGKKRKENLLWQLDMLEAKASRDVSNTRLVRAQFAANKQIRKTKKKERQGQKRNDRFENPHRADMIASEIQDREEQEQGPVEISVEDQAKIKELRVKVVEQKIHHYSKDIQKALKTAKTTEALKINKRIKAQEGNEEKIKKLQEEQTELKTIDVALLTSIHSVRTMQKAFVPTQEQRDDPPDYLPDSIVKPTEDSPLITFNRTASHSLMTVAARLCNTAAVKAACESMVTAVKYAVKIEKKETASDIAKRKKQEKKERKAKAKALEDSDNEEFKKYSDMIAASSDEESDEETGQSILGTTRAPAGDDESEDEAEGADDFFVFPEDDDNVDQSDLEITENSSLKKKKDEKKKEDKYVLPALASGYFSGGSDDEMEEEPRDRGYNLSNDSVVKDATTQRKNRRGQRARRQIAELKYGKNANHLKKEREEKQQKWAQRQGEFEKREARRKELGIERPEQKKLPELSEKKPLHPSWEAKKKLSAAPVKFEGKKVVF